MAGVIGVAGTAIICGLIAFLVTYALVVEVAAFAGDRTVFAATVIALTVMMIAAVLVKPVITQWEFRAAAVWHNGPDPNTTRGGHLP
jgi:hypothetical protein